MTQIGTDWRVVGGATRLIRDGQRVRVDGTHGYVETRQRPGDDQPARSPVRPGAQRRDETHQHPGVGLGTVTSAGSRRLPLHAAESSTVIGDRDELTHLIEHMTW